MVESKKEDKKMLKIIRWFWSLIKNLFWHKPKEIIPLRQFKERDDKTTRRIRKFKRLSKKINRGKNKGKTQRRHK